MPLKDPEARRRYHREYMRAYLAEDSERKRKMLARTARNSARYFQEKRAWLDAYLAGHPCIDCGNDDPEVLEFDHVRGSKLFNVGDLKRGGYSLRTLIAEIEKCEVRCANCHRKVTRRRERERSGVV